MALIKMSVLRYRVLRGAAWAEAEKLREKIVVLAGTPGAERRHAELVHQRGALLNAIDALDSHFPLQKAEAEKQALNELANGD